MVIKPIEALKNEYTSISLLAHEAKEPIYITKNGEADLVVMSIENYEARERMLELRVKIIQAEEERIKQAKTLSISDVKKELGERIDEI